MILPSLMQQPLDVLVLYAGYWTDVNTTREHLHSLAIHSRHRVYYAPATNDAPCDIDLNLFDVIIIHYSVRLIFPRHGLTPEFLHAVAAYDGLKILFIQDDYD